MDNYYLGIKIIKYLDYPDLYQASQVSTNWRKATQYLIYSIPCHQCQLTGLKVWRRIKYTAHDLNYHPIYHCIKCITLLESSLNYYLPGIPLEPGETRFSWHTSDTPIIWRYLWFHLTK